MALINARLTIELDRSAGTFSVSADSMRIYAQDEKVSVKVIGWTLEEVTKTSGKTPYEPYLKVTDCNGITLAECKLEPASTPAPEEQGGSVYAMFANLSTNTDKMVGKFAEMCLAPGMSMEFNALVYSSAEANPIACGIVDVFAFDGINGSAPSNLPTASEVLAATQADLNAHKANAQNPHSVTAAQVGAYSKGEADALFASLTSQSELSAAIAQANAAILALQAAVASANAAIASHGLTLAQKADAASVYRKDETYSKGETNSLIAGCKAGNLLAGKVFSVPNNDRGRTEMIAYLVRALGGNMATAGIVPGTAANRITMTASDGAVKSLVVVKDGTEYKTEVV